MFKGPFRVSDIAQQVVGGYLLAGPFVVTEEVWLLASGMSVWQAILSYMVTVIIGWLSLYEADNRREEDEVEIVHVPVRLISLLTVSCLSVTSLVFLFSAPFVFDAGVKVTLTAIGIGSIFSVVGAATADSFF